MTGWPNDVGMSSPSVRRWIKIVVALAVAVGFFLVAINGEVAHETTPRHIATVIFGSDVNEVHSPLNFSLRIAVRKIYSIVAFALVGMAAELALPRTKDPTLRMVALIAAYSALIEVVQFALGSKEGLFWNIFDVACGGIGGWIAGRFTAPRWERF